MAKILYVEDNEDNIYMLSQRLQRKGFDVDVARDGQEGVHKATQDLPDLILMDLDLPVLTGWEATQLLKDADETSHIPIIVLTSYAMKGDREKAISAGADDFETKPVKLANLMEKITRYLGKPETG